MFEWSSVLERYAVKGKEWRVVTFVAHVPSGIATIFTQQTRGIVFGMTLNENHLAPVLLSRRHAPVRGLGVDDDVVTGVLKSFSRHRIPARVRKEDLRLQSRGQWLAYIDVL